jgi:hypothetical protein
MKTPKLRKRESRRKTDGTSAREKGRLRPMVQITLTPEAIEMADELALRRGLHRSTLIDQLLREEARRERVGIFATGAAR